MQIETTTSVDNADEIASTHGVDAVMVGPGDLAMSAGLRPGLDSHHDDMQRLYERIIDSGSRAGKPTGSFSLLGPEDARQTWELDWDFVADFHDRITLQIVAGDHRRR